MKRLLYWIVSILNQCFIKKKNIMFFYDNGMISYNEFELIRWMQGQEYASDFKMVLFTNMPEKARALFPYNIKVISGEGQALLYHLIAKYVFVEQNGYRWICKTNKNQKVVQLWHGVPIKKVGNLNNKESWYKYDDVYQYVVAPSEYSWSIMKKCFGYSDDKKIICPYPRCDALFRPLTRSRLTKLCKREVDILFLWLPTFRTAYFEKNRKAKSEFPVLTEDNINNFNEFLKDNHITIIIKMHTLQRKIPLFRKEFSNLLFFDNNQLLENSLLLYELLGSCDCLISDYSSVIYDYLLLDRPMIFTIDDLEDYEQRRGFIDSRFIEQLPGPKVKTINDLKLQILSVLRYDSYRTERLNLCKKMNGISNISYSERLYKMIGLL